MKNITYLLFFLSFLAFTSCQQSSGNENSQNATASPEALLPEPGPSEDELWLSLAPYMIPDPLTDAEREQNRILDYALEKGIAGSFTTSGLFYQLKGMTDTSSIAWGDRLQVFYTGYFLNGEVFDRSQNPEKPFEFYVGNMIDGWNEGLQLANPGAELILIVPSQLAYGKDGLKDKQGRYVIPPDEILVFEITVHRSLQTPAISFE